MVNKFDGDWPSRLIRVRPSPQGERREGQFAMRHVDDRHVDISFEGTFVGRVPTPETIPPSITFARIQTDGTTITYQGWMTSERGATELSRVCGTYFILRPGLGALNVESGDWTINRPPPDAFKARRKTAGAKKRSGASKKTSPSRKAARSETKKGPESS